MGASAPPAPNPIPGIQEQTAKLLAELQRNAAATIAAALITASERPHSIQEARDLLQHVEFALRPRPELGSYQAWAKEDHVSQPHR